MVEGGKNNAASLFSASFIVSSPQFHLYLGASTTLPTFRSSLCLPRRVWAGVGVRGSEEGRQDPIHAQVDWVHDQRDAGEARHRWHARARSSQARGRPHDAIDGHA